MSKEPGKSSLKIIVSAKEKATENSHWYYKSNSIWFSPKEATWYKKFNVKKKRQLNIWLDLLWNISDQNSKINSCFIFLPFMNIFYKSFLTKRILQSMVHFRWETYRCSSLVFMWGYIVDGSSKIFLLTISEYACNWHTKLSTLLLNVWNLAWTDEDFQLLQSEAGVIIHVTFIFILFFKKEKLRYLWMSWQLYISVSPRATLLHY